MTILHAEQNKFHLNSGSVEMIYRRVGYESLFYINEFMAKMKGQTLQQRCIQHLKKIFVEYPC